MVQHLFRHPGQGSRPVIRAARMACADGTQLRLTYYRPGGQAAHSHDFTQISFLLAGSMLEAHGSREYEVGGASKGVKLPGQSHENRWGREGALILSANLADGGLVDPAGREEPGWGRIASGNAVARLASAALIAPSAQAREEILCDLMAVTRAPARALKSVPRWLRRAREAISEAPRLLLVADAAEEAGVHRVHFSRLFRLAYGEPPSLFRQRVQIGRALARIMQSAEPLGEIAVEAGFSDQAHMSRCVKAATGLSPGQLRVRLA